VWEYGFSFFLTSLRAMQYVQKELIKCMATGIGLAFSNKEEQDLFFKES